MTVAPVSSASPSSRYDLILRNGTVIDGTGTPGFSADVAVLDGRIAFVGTLLPNAEAVRVLDASGLAVCPGFIDIHTHSDVSVLYTPGMDSSLAQGVTSEVVGNCGFSLGLARNEEVFTGELRGLLRTGLVLDWPDLAGFLRRIEDQGIAINLATLAGHGTLRKLTMGLASRLPDAEEIAAMQRDLAEILEQGAVGLSSGLEYVPGMYADVAELTALATVARDAGTFYATHLRDEGDGLIAAVEEAIAVAEGAGLPLQLSHHKAERPRNWGKVVETLALVDAAEARGVDVLLDQYPYTAYQTGLATIALPPWAAMGTPVLLAESLQDPSQRARVRAEMPDVDWRAIEIATCPDHPDFIGRTIAELAESSGGIDPRDWTLRLFAEGGTFTSAIHHALSEEDVERVLRDGRVMIGSDGVATDPNGPLGGDKMHPRTYGTFPRVLGHYAREKGLLSVEEAVRRMTSLPAKRLGWTDRGRLAVGCRADLAVFAPAAIVDRATFAAPHAFPTGVRYVLVNGTLAFADGIATGARAGQVIRRN